MSAPICPTCKAPLHGRSIGYKVEDVSLSHDDLGFVEIFFCNICGAVLSINSSD